jgi:nucleoid-associated protein YgaU
MVAGENLQHIATANYGRPGAWRALAAANGIEDPFAVRPGTVIYLPAVTELTDGGGG